MQTLFMRFALAAGFLSAVADRLGAWGPYGSPAVAWGDMAHFLPYVAQLNPWFPSSFIPAVGWLANVAEIGLGIMLLVGWRTRMASRLSGLLVLGFAGGMIAGVGIKEVLNFSVLVVAGGAFLLSGAHGYRFSLDELLAERRGAAIGQR